MVLIVAIVVFISFGVLLYFNEDMILKSGIFLGWTFTIVGVIGAPLHKLKEYYEKKHNSTCKPVAAVETINPEFLSCKVDFNKMVHTLNRNKDLQIINEYHTAVKHIEVARNVDLLKGEKSEAFIKAQYAKMQFKAACKADNMLSENGKLDFAFYLKHAFEMSNKYGRILARETKKAA